MTAPRPGLPPELQQVANRLFAQFIGGQPAPDPAPPPAPATPTSEEPPTP